MSGWRREWRARSRRLAAAVPGWAAAVATISATPLTAQAPSTQALQDNSFLIEEAYNQAPGVVQEISSFVRSSGGADWVFTFTQEWPVGGMRHQLSYAISFEHHADFATTGLGDALFNYRYQALGLSGGRVYMAPRLSAVLPTGRAASGRGSGAWGVQTNVPVTVEVSPTLSTHWNAGVTILPSAESFSGAHATTTAINAGTSVIWLVRPLFNLLLEGVWVREQNVVGPGTTSWDTSVFLNPGFRWAFNFRGGLQVATGLAYTVSLNDVNPDALFVYLSFEHPFRRIRS